MHVNVVSDVYKLQSFSSCVEVINIFFICS